MDILLLYFVIAMGINILMFIPAFIFRTDKLTDLSYGITFISLVIIAFFLNDLNVNKIILGSMVIIWGLRLGLFLFIRIGKMKKDRRFDERRENLIKLLSFWLLQGFTVFVIMIPSIFYLSGPAGKICYIGLFIWAFGFIFETIADTQKFYFNENPDNKGHFINVGLWSVSRHPNYFGEMLCWIGIYIFVALSMSPRELLINLVSPLYIILLLSFVSGIPLLEKYADKKWGKDGDYKEYKRQTSILIPWFRKK